MRVLSGTPSIKTEIKEKPDSPIAARLTRHLEFGAEFNPEDPADLLTVFVIEPTDTLQTIDAAMDGCFLTNHYLFGSVRWSLIALMGALLLLSPTVFLVRDFRRDGGVELDKLSSGFCLN
jgi:hypothetical protein